MYSQALRWFLVGAFGAAAVLAAGAAIAAARRGWAKAHDQAALPPPDDAIPEAERIVPVGSTV